MKRPGPLVVDATTLRNFSVIGRLDILRAYAGDDICWVEAVEAEIRTGLYNEDSERQDILDHGFWLGTPERFEDGREEIEIIRRSLGGTRKPGEQRKHLGEAQSIYLIETAFEGVGTFLTDDRPALIMARRRGLNAVDTFDILGDCFAEESLKCPQPFELLVQMADSGRGVRLPNSHTDIC